MPRTSIIMPNYNGMPFLKDAVYSVMQQDDPDWELICVDNGSTDEGFQWLREQARHDPRIVPILYQDKKGPTHARNKALAHAKGRYIAFLDSDDIWYRDKLARQIPYMQAERAAMCCSWYDLIDEQGHSVGARSFRSRKITRQRLLKGSEIGCLSVIYDRQIVGDRQMPEVGHEDYALWLDILDDIPFVACMPESMAAYRLRQKSVSSNKWIAAQYQWQVLRRHLGLSLVKASYFFAHYAVRGALRIM